MLMTSFGRGPHRSHPGFFAGRGTLVNILADDYRQRFELLWHKVLGMEKELVEAGGLPMAGSDSTDVGQALSHRLRQSPGD
jgi:hypothetical protein